MRYSLSHSARSRTGPSPPFSPLTTTTCAAPRCSIKLNNKQIGRYLLGFYAFMMVLVMIMEFAAAIAIFAYVGKLESVNPDAKGVRLRCGAFFCDVRVKA